VSIRIRRWTSAARRALDRDPEDGTGRLPSSAGAGQAPASIHPGAVYLHQGESYVVDSLDFEDGVAFVHTEDPGYTTFARELTDIVVTGQGERKEIRVGHRWPRTASVTTVIGYCGAG
jgi:DEAD/DEAH box helicase domain-containing protein